jgi:hypothetical protein
MQVLSADKDYGPPGVSRPAMLAPATAEPAHNALSRMRTPLVFGFPSSRRCDRLPRSPAEKGRRHGRVLLMWTWGCQAPRRRFLWSTMQTKKKRQRWWREHAVDCCYCYWLGWYVLPLR